MWSTYRGDFAFGEGAVDAIELKLVVHILFLEFDVGGTVDGLGRHDGKGCITVDSSQLQRRRISLVYGVSMGIFGEIKGQWCWGRIAQGNMKKRGKADEWLERRRLYCGRGDQVCARLVTAMMGQDASFQESTLAMTQSHHFHPNALMPNLCRECVEQS